MTGTGGAQANRARRSQKFFQADNIAEGQISYPECLGAEGAGWLSNPGSRLRPRLSANEEVSTLETSRATFFRSPHVRITFPIWL